jgi:hypothetical protein
MDPQLITPADRLAVIEILDRDGHVRTVIPVWQWPVTIGRAISNDVVIDDVHAAALHVTLADDEGTLRASVGETINGVRIGHRRVPAGTGVEVTTGEVLQIGATRMRVRRATDPLAPEVPVGEESTTGFTTLLALLAALVGWSVGEQWLRSNPGGRFTDYLPLLLAIPIGVVIWSGVWSVGSKLVRHRFDFRAHERVVLSYALAGSVINAALPLAAFITGWVFLSRIVEGVVGAVLCAMVVAHLRLILPTRSHVLTAFAGVAFVVATGLGLFRNYQVNDRLFSELYVTTLAPPAFRLASGVAPEHFLEEARSLKAVLDAHVDDNDTDGNGQSGD